MIKYLNEYLIKFSIVKYLNVKLSSKVRQWRFEVIDGLVMLYKYSRIMIIFEFAYDICFLWLYLVLVLMSYKWLNIRGGG